MPMSFGGISKSVVATKIVAADGSGDYTDIQTAINVLPVGGGVVYIKEGIYTITSTISILSDNIELHGAGNSTIIKRDSGLSGSVIEISDGSTVVEGVRIMNLQIDGNRSSSSSGLKGIDLKGSSTEVLGNISIKDCYIHHTGDDGIKATYTQELVVVSCIISDCYDDGIDGINSSIIVSICFISDNQYQGIYIESAPFSNPLYHNPIFDSNHLFNNGYGGLTMQSVNYIIISNNVSYNNNSLDVGQAGIQLNMYCDRCIINGNVCIDNQASPTQARGIWISDSSDNNNIVTSNVCYNNVTAQIDNSGTGTVLDNNVTS